MECGCGVLGIGARRVLLAGLGLVWLGLLGLAVLAWEPESSTHQQFALVVAGVGLGLVAALIAVLVRVFARVERERRHTRRTLDDREGFLTRLAASTPATIFVFDVVEGRTVYSNRRFADALGYPQEEIARRGDEWLVSLLHPDDLPQYKRQLTEYDHAADGDVIQGELRFKNAKGGWTWLASWATVASREADGRARLIVGTSMDITRRREMEAELRRSEERFRLLAENARDIVSRYQVYPERRMEFISPSVEAILGYPLRDFYEDPDLHGKLIHPEDRALLDSLSRDPSRIERPVTLRWVHQDGHTVWLEQRMVAFRDDQGRLLAVENISRDVTETKRLEELLRHAQKMDAIGRLAGGVAHDFNNVLGVIIGYTDLLKRHVGGSAQADEALGAIEEVSQRAAAMTRQLLAFARRDASKPRVLDLNATVTALEQMLRRLLPEHIAFTTDLADSVPAVNADPGQVEQALLNLVVNARDAMPEGGQLRLETARAAGGGVQLLVHDTGAGMDVATRDHVFEPFFTTKERGKGTGLGLAMVYAIMRQAGGSVTVESSLGAGSTFVLTFPEAREEVEDAPSSNRRPVAAGGTETILLVEDEPQLLSLVERMLSERGYHVLTAQTGPDALALATRQRGVIDLLVTDLVIPEFDGRALAERLTAMRPALAVIYMSGYLGDLATREEGDRFIEKPFTPEQLARLVRSTLDSRRRAGIA